MLVIAIFLIFSSNPVGLYLHDSNDGIGDTEVTLKAAPSYLDIMLIGLPFLGISIFLIRSAGPGILSMKKGKAPRFLFIENCDKLFFVILMRRGTEQ